MDVWRGILLESIVHKMTIVHFYVKAFGWGHSFRQLSFHINTNINRSIRKVKFLSSFWQHGMWHSTFPLQTGIRRRYLFKVLPKSQFIQVILDSILFFRKVKRRFCHETRESSIIYEAHRYLRWCIGLGCKYRWQSTAALWPKTLDPQRPSLAIASKSISFSSQTNFRRRSQIISNSMRSLYVALYDPHLFLNQIEFIRIHDFRTDSKMILCDRAVSVFIQST